MANLTKGYSKYQSNKNANPKKNIHEFFLEEDDDEFQSLNIYCHTTDTTPTKT